MNKVFLVGNLTRDPEHSTTTSGISVCKLGIAVTRRFASADGTRETDFFNITTWRSVADNCSKYLKKGSKVAVCGSIQTRSYEAQDGTKKYVTDIVAEEVEFLSSKPSESSGSTVTPETHPQETVAELQPVEDDDLPF